MKSGNRSSGAKKRGPWKNVEEYLACVPETSRSSFNKLRAAIRSAVPRDAVEIISYQIPAFKQKRVLVWFAAFSNHCSLFPTASVIDKFKDELKGLTISKGTVQFPADKPLPTVLVRNMVKARVAENEIKNQR